MELRHSIWQEVERYLQDSNAVVMPIGSTEQHGPNGLIGTDALCPESLALEMGKQSGALIAPTISVGMAQHHLAFPGSITLRRSTLILVIRDMVNSLIQQGFERFYFLNGHGGNIATVHAAYSEIYAQSSLGAQPTNYSGVRCRLKNWWEADGVMALSKDLFGDADGIPQNQHTYYMGTTGGVWKTTNAGACWRPVSDDDFGSASVGAIAVAPSDSNVVYVGMGESPFRNIASSQCDGVYRSTDAGESWTHIGFGDVRQIGEIRVHPNDSARVEAYVNPPAAAH